VRIARRLWSTASATIFYSKTAAWRLCRARVRPTDSIVGGGAPAPFRAVARPVTRGHQLRRDPSPEGSLAFLHSVRRKTGTGSCPQRNERKPVDDAGRRPGHGVLRVSGHAGGPALRLGRVPVRVHGMGVYYRRFFGPGSDYFHRIGTEHAFQSLPTRPSIWPTARSSPSSPVTNVPRATRRGR
jgi:hypothetical protein